MKQQNKLRNALRDYYDNQPAQFDTNDWEEASAFLHSARRKRKLRLIVIVLISVLTPLFIALINFYETPDQCGFYASSDANETLKQAPFYKSVKITSSAVTSTQSNNRTYTKPKQRIPASVKADIPSTQNPVNSSTNRGTSRSKINPVQVAKPEIKAPLVYLDTEEKITRPENVINTILVSKTSVTSNFNPVATNQPDINTLLKSTFAKENSNDISVEHEVSALSRIQTHNEDSIPSFLNLPIQEESPAQVFDNRNEISQANSTQTNKADEKALSHSFNSTNTFSVQIPTAESDVAHVDTTSELPLNKSLAGEGIFYEAGTTWHYGWKGPLNRDALGFSPMAGIHYMNELSHHFGLSFGISYLQVRNLSNSGKTSRQSTYDYGEQSKVTVIAPATLHYLTLPLRLHYYKNSKNSFGSGLNLAYLLNVDAKITHFEESPGRKENYTSEKLSGYTEGFSWFDCQMAFLYSRRLTSSINLQTELFLGLTDVKQDKFFGFDNKERISGAKLSLVYFAFRKKDRP